MKKAYKIGRNRQGQIAWEYRTFQTAEEALRYSGIAFRGEQVVIERDEQYPNSRFINNRALSVRGGYYA